jgi:hypothetical protein
VPCRAVACHAVGCWVQVHELQALRQQLEPEVEIPQLQPLRDEVERLDELLHSLNTLQVGGHVLHKCRLSGWLLVRAPLSFLQQGLQPQAVCWTRHQWL